MTTSVDSRRAAEGSVATWVVRPIAGLVGAEVSGVDLRAPLDVAAAEHLKDLLATYGVVVFSGQQIDSRGHRALAESLGPIKMPPEYLPNLAADGFPDISVLSSENGFGRVADRWHSDVTWAAAPPRYSVLHMQVVPPEGGDTMWSSQIEAFARLSEPMKALLEPLTARHDILSDECMANHPVVCRHPRSGRKALFVNPTFTRRINELSEQESDAVLSLLSTHATQPELLCRWRWTEGDVAIWDNHFVMHYAINDYAGSRKIHRIEIQGEPPVPAA